LGVERFIDRVLGELSVRRVGREERGVAGRVRLAHGLLALAERIEPARA